MAGEPEKYLLVTEPRPDGSGLLGGGWLAIISGAILMFFGMIIEVDSYSVAEDLSLKLALLMLGGALVNIGVFLAMGGLIIRAIWFLPARPWRLKDHGNFASSPATASPSPAMPAAIEQTPPPDASRPTETSEDNSNDWLNAAITLIIILGIIGLVFVALDLWGRLRDDPDVGALPEVEINESASFSTLQKEHDDLLRNIESAQDGQ